MLMSCNNIAGGGGGVRGAGYDEAWSLLIVEASVIFYIIGILPSRHKIYGCVST